MSRMIVIAAKYGQLGNRLLHFSHFIATAIEHSLEIRNPAFEEYAPYFIATSRDAFCSFPLRRASGRPASALSRRIAYAAAAGAAAALNAVRSSRVINIGWDVPFDLADETFIREASTRTLFARGWLFRNDEAVKRQRNAIRAFFTPLQQYTDAARRAEEEARARGSVVVGIHIRQRDYATFQGGRYFYALDDYKALMRHLASQLGDRCAFLVCSDVAIPAHEFSEFLCVAGPGHLVSDMYALARCDYIAGPPSTFTKWASYYGGVPLYHLGDAAARPVLSEFVKV